MDVAKVLRVAKLANDRHPRTFHGMEFPGCLTTRQLSLNVGEWRYVRCLIGPLEPHPAIMRTPEILTMKLPTVSSFAFYAVVWTMHAQVFPSSSGGCGVSRSGVMACDWRPERQIAGLPTARQ